MAAAPLLCLPPPGSIHQLYARRKKPPALRGRVAERRTAWGIKRDAAANNVRGQEAVISTADSPIKVMVVPTNEELVIARDTRDIVAK